VAIVAVIYEVWDTQTANQIGAFQTESEARSLLADVLRVNGPEVAREMVILAYDPDGPRPLEPVTILEGVDFVAEATEHV
jgi:hypothetical protein